MVSEGCDVNFCGGLRCVHAYGPTHVSARDDGVARLHVGEHAVRPYVMVGHGGSLQKNPSHP